VALALVLCWMDVQVKKLIDTFDRNEIVATKLPCLLRFTFASYLPRYHLVERLGQPLERVSYNFAIFFTADLTDSPRLLQSIYRFGYVLEFVQQKSGTTRWRLSRFRFFRFLAQILTFALYSSRIATVLFSQKPSK